MKKEIMVRMNNMYEIEELRNTMRNDLLKDVIKQFLADCDRMNTKEREEMNLAKIPAGSVTVDESLRSYIEKILPELHDAEEQFAREILIDFYVADLYKNAEWTDIMLNICSYYGLVENADLLTSGDCRVAAALYILKTRIREKYLCGDNTDIFTVPMSVKSLLKL